MSRPSIERVVAATAAATGLNTGDLKGKSRIKPIVWARHVSAIVAFELGHSKRVIGRTLGNRDRTTILAAIQRYKISTGYRRSYCDRNIAKVKEILNADD